MRESESACSALTLCMHMLSASGLIMKNGDQAACRAIFFQIL